MKELNVTKGMPVERVKPLALLDHIKACGAGEKRVEESSISALDPRDKMQWRRELLIRYAHRLLECSEKIFEDSRLFLTPVPINGTTPLGVVIDWWQNYRCSMVEDGEGCLFPIYGWDCGPYKKMGHLCNADHKRGVYYIADGVGYFTPTESVKGLRESLQEVSRCYEGVCSVGGVFDIEDAIELLLGEKVYDRC
jgi:hypothetical protein